MTVLFSSPKLASDTSYTIYSGDSISGGSNFNGLVTGATDVAGTKVSAFTSSGMVMTVSNTSGNGGQDGGWR